MCEQPLGIVWHDFGRWLTHAELKRLCRTHAYMKIEFTAQPVFTKGTSTPGVTLSVVQARRGLVGAFPLAALQREGILNVSMTLMKHFIACEEVRERVNAQVAVGRAAIDEGT